MAIRKIPDSDIDIYCRAEFVRVDDAAENAPIEVSKRDYANHEVFCYEFKL